MIARVLPLTVYVAAADVQRALGCSRSLAYWHLARAAGRVEGSRGLLRVPLHTWEEYARRTFVEAQEEPKARPQAPRAHRAPAPGLRLVANDSIRATQPRTKKRKDPAA